MNEKILSVFLSICFVIASSLAAPITKHMVDLTYTFDEKTLYWPGNREFKLDVKVIPEEEIWTQFEEYSSAVHLGTHMDAPSHYSKGGITVDQISTASLIAPAAVIDITTKAESNPDAEITIEDLLEWESTTGQSLDGTIVLLRFGWGEKWNNRDAFYGTTENGSRTLHFPGLAGEAAKWLVNNRTIVGIGTEALSFDAGVNNDFPAHKVFLPEGIYGLENIANMDKLPIYGATLYVMPMKIGKGSGAPTRIIATIPDVIFN